MRDQFTKDGILLDQALGFSIYRVYQGMRSEMYQRFRAAAGEEVTPEQWIVLVRLWEQDGRTQQELGDATLKDRSTLSRILDVMERRGWVVRQTHPEDGRSRLVHLTRAGRDLKSVLVPLAKTLVTDMTEGIPNADLEVLRRVLLRIHQNLA